MSGPGSYEPTDDGIQFERLELSGIVLRTRVHGFLLILRWAATRLRHPWLHPVRRGLCDENHRVTSSSDRRARANGLFDEIKRGR
jgi:hypothetical protein